MVLFADMLIKRELAMGAQSVLVTCRVRAGLVAAVSALLKEVLDLLVFASAVGLE